MSPQNDTPQHDDEPTPEALSATEADENPLTHTGVPNRDESDETMTTFKPPQIDMELAARTIAQTARAAQRVRDAEAELAAAREAEVAIHAIRRGSLGPDEALKLALELIGRRTDIVAVQLPEPTSTRYEGPDHEPADRLGWWEHGSLWGVSQWGYPNQVQLAFNGEPFEPLSSDEARFLAAALLAAANVADAAEDGAQ